MSFTNDDNFQFRGHDPRGFTGPVPDWKDKAIPGLPDWDGDGQNDIWDLLFLISLENPDADRVGAHHDSVTGDVNVYIVDNGQTSDWGTINYSELPAGSDGIW